VFKETPAEELIEANGHAKVSCSKQMLNVVTVFGLVINSYSHYCDLLLSQQLQPVVPQVSGKFIFQQVPQHTGHACFQTLIFHKVA